MSFEIEPCTSFMVVPPIGAAFDDPQLLARLQRELEDVFPDFVFLVTTDGPGRFADFYIVPIMIYDGDGTGIDDQATIDKTMLHDLARVLAPYIGSDDRVDLIVRTGDNPVALQGDDDRRAKPPVRH